MKDLVDILSEQKLFRGMDREYLQAIAGCGSNVRFAQGQMLTQEGDPANRFFLIKHGRVSIEIYVPHKGPMMLETVLEGQVLGWSWLFPPYEWQYDARAIVLTRAVAFDGNCLRAKLEKDKAFGYEMMRRFASVMTQRLNAARLQMMDVYGSRT